MRRFAPLVILGSTFLTLAVATLLDASERSRERVIPAFASARLWGGDMVIVPADEYVHDRCCNYKEQCRYSTVDPCDTWTKTGGQATCEQTLNPKTEEEVQNVDQKACVFKASPNLQATCWNSIDDLVDCKITFRCMWEDGKCVRNPMKKTATQAPRYCFDWNCPGTTPDPVPDPDPGPVP